LYPTIGHEFPSQGRTSIHLTLYPFHGTIRNIFPSPHVIQPRYITYLYTNLSLLRSDVKFSAITDHK